MSSDEDFGSMLEASLTQTRKASARKLRNGERVSGQVVAIGKEWIFVDVGAKSEARIARHELCDADGQPRVAVGDTLQATVARGDGPEGPLLVVKLGGRGRLAVEALELAASSGTPIEGRITAAARGGVEVEVVGVRAFCPGSQLDLTRAGELASWVGQVHFFKVVEVRDGGRSVVLSRRALLQAERTRKAEELLERLAPGAELDGIVDSVKPYGVFVDLGGLHGLVHVSELAHTRVADPADFVSVGERVRVRVLSVTAPTGKDREAKVSLSLKALQQAPVADDPGKADQIVSVTVMKVEPFGVIVDTPQGPGVVPTRELGLPQGGDPRRAFKPGDSVSAVTMGRDGSGRLRLSIAKVHEAEARQNFRDFRATSSGTRALGNLGDLLQALSLPKPK
jgi:small subunit ribosomal protein S1